jgi:predicted SnoaL-like aldol condensation-catalyzing enzyme
MIEEVANQKNVDNIEEFFAEDYGELTPGGTFKATSYDEVRAYWSDLLPDLTVEALDIIAEGDLVAMRFMWAAPETGLEESQAAYLFRFKDGVIVEGWEFYDRLPIDLYFGLVEIVEQEPGEITPSEEITATESLSPTEALAASPATGSLTGLYGLTLEGTMFVAAPDTEEISPLSFNMLGSIQADGTGQITAGARTINFGGDVGEDTVTGTYTVTAEGALTLVLTAAQADKPVAVEEFVCYITASGERFDCTVTRIARVDLGPEPVEVPVTALAHGVRLTGAPLSDD